MFKGSKALVKGNKAGSPPVAGAWYQGYGVYLTTGKPTTDGIFDPSKQVTGNTKA